jgi:hypothetical protein
MRFAILGLCFVPALFVACNAPTAPDGAPNVEHMKAFAYAHRYEVCVSDGAGEFLVPMVDHDLFRDARIVPISRCDHAE